jgi:hypothetical protein
MSSSARSLERALDDDAEVVRGYAGWALGRVGEVPSSTDKLRARLGAERSGVVSAGMLEGLYRLVKDEDDLEQLLAHLRSSDGETRAFASNSVLGVASPENVAMLSEALRRAADIERYPAIRQVLEANLATLDEMRRDNDFELE